LSEEEVCRDMLEKLKETKQVYIVEHDVPISVSKHIFRLLDERRKLEAKRRSLPEEQYEWEDLLFHLALKGEKHSDPLVQHLASTG